MDYINKSFYLTDPPNYIGSNNINSNYILNCLIWHIKYSYSTDIKKIWKYLEKNNIVLDDMICQEILFAAVSANKIDIIDFMYNKKTNIRVNNDELLLYSIDENKIEITEYLLKRGAKITDDMISMNDNDISKLLINYCDNTQYKLFNKNIIRKY